MTPAEREALKLAAQKSEHKKWEHRDGVIVGDGRNLILGNWCSLSDMEFVGRASPEAILHLLSLISSLEITLSNAEGVMEVQAKRIEELERELSIALRPYPAAPNEPTPALEVENAQLRAIGKQEGLEKC